jgi:hypothetical protein
MQDRDLSRTVLDYAERSWWISGVLSFLSKHCYELEQRMDWKRSNNRLQRPALRAAAEPER